MRRFLAQTSRSVVVFTSGLVLVVAGLAGLALPILPGWALIIAGIVLWSREFPWAMRLREWVTERFRSAREKVRDRVRERTAEHRTSEAQPGPDDDPPKPRREPTGIDAA